MKKILLATTMLVGTAGFAAAEVAMSGSASMGYKNAETALANDQEGSINHSITLGVSMSGESDAGLSFGASFDILANNGGALTNDGPGSVFISGAFGKLAMGDVGDADAQGGISDVGYDGIGIDDLAESLDGTGNSTVRYTYSAGAISASVSTALSTGTANTSEAAFGVKYTGEGFYVGVGYSDNDKTVGAITAADGQTTSVYVGGTFSGVTVDAMWSSRNSETNVAADDREVYGLSASYTMDAITLTAAFSNTDAVGVKSSSGVGVSYDLGGGASVAAGFGSVNGLSRSDIGVNFKF
jgi:outer membrane protein OmpU